jgi:glycine betaine/choline ABC-type transport system substrate-binding protein
MKKVILLCVSALILTIAQLSLACVGKTIHIGISNTSNERLLAEMASLLITERTGSSVSVDVYKDSKDLYNAVKKGNVNVLIETPGNALEMLGKTKGTVGSSTLAFVKAEYRKNLNLVWLEPIGGSQQYSSVLTVDTLSNYPALPKLLNKLSGALSNDTYTKLLRSVDSADKTKKTAKDFLKGKKLI